MFKNIIGVSGARNIRGKSFWIKETFSTHPFKIPFFTDNIYIVGVDFSQSDNSFFGRLDLLI